MASTIAQRSFSGGELSPSLYPRCDTIKYGYGARAARNVFIQKSGGFLNRGGTKFVGEITDSTKNARLIPFTNTAGTSYILAFGDELYNPVISGSYDYATTLTITGVSNANPGVVTYVGSDPTNGTVVYISGVLGAIGTYLNNRTFKVANVNGGANTFELQTMAAVNFNTTSLGAYTSAGTAKTVTKVTTPYDYTDLSRLTYAQASTTIAFAHSEYALDGDSTVTTAVPTFSTLTDYADGVNNGVTAGAVTGAAGTVRYYFITSINSITGEESTRYAAGGTTGTFPRTITWNDGSMTEFINIYATVLGVVGLIGTVGAGIQTFIDTGITPDFDQTYPDRNSYVGYPAEGPCPAAVAFHQQRMVLGSVTKTVTGSDYPDIVLASRTGLLGNFTENFPVTDSSVVTLKAFGNRFNRIKHLLGLDSLLIFTGTGVWSSPGNADGAFTPSAGIKQQSSAGCADVAPLLVDETVLYVQESANVVRDLGFDINIDGYKGNDLTTFSTHLFEGYTIVDWAYQKLPHSIVWAVRDDGALLSLTYIREHQIAGWTRHDTDGLVENVCVITENGEDALYMVVKRTIGGVAKRYIEKLHSRIIDDVIDSVFLDSSYTYDGRNLAVTTMTISGGTTWDYDELLTLTSSAAFFTSADVGNRIDIEGADGTIIRFTIAHYTSTTVVTGFPSKIVPAAMRSSARATWTKAIKQVTGLWHLEGKSVGVFADRYVVASPNNDNYNTLTVTNGTINLDQPYGVIHVGLPYISDVETLDIDTASSETLANKKMLINELTIWVEATRGVFTGPQPPDDDDADPLQGLYESKLRDDEQWNEPVELRTGTIKEVLDATWNSNGRVFIRQVDPLPLAVLAVAPSGMIPFKQGGG